MPIIARPMPSRSSVAMHGNVAGKMILKNTCRSLVVRAALKSHAIGMPVRTSRPIGQSFHPAIFMVLRDLAACLRGISNSLSAILLPSEMNTVGTSGCHFAARR